MNSKKLRVRLALSAVGAIMFVAAFAALWQSPALAAPKSGKSELADESAFVSESAISTRDAGTPIGPPKRFIICWRGRTIWVPERAVPVFIKRGAYVGPCTNQFSWVICRHGHTLIVPPDDQKTGDLPGICSNQVFMCNLHLHTYAVRPDKIAKAEAKGHHLGICPGQTLICHKGHSMVVPDSKLQEHLNHGDCVGYCLGAQGPWLEGVSHCTTNPPALAAIQ